MRVLVQTWSESERGWGTRPDGLSIHFSEEQRLKYIDEHWERYKEMYGDKTPDEYDRPDRGGTYWATFVFEEADEDITKLALKGKSFREWKNSPKWLKRV